MTNWEHFLRGAIPHKIDFISLIRELAGANAVFLSDYHSGSAPHSGNEKKIIEEIVKIPDVFLGLEYHSCEDCIAPYHRPLIEASRNCGKEPFFLAPQNKTIKNREFWEFNKEYEKYILESIKKKISEGRKLVAVLGENHTRPGEKYCAGIPYLLNGNTITAVVYQDLLKQYQK